MAIDATGNGIAYVGDLDGVSVYQLKYAGADVLQVGARQDDSDHKIMVRKSLNDEWLITEGKAMEREDGRISGQFMHMFIVANMPRLLLDTYVIPEMISKTADVPDGVPTEWTIPE